MMKRVFILILVVVAGVALGVTVVLKQQERSLTRQILVRQNRLVDLNERMAQKLGVEKEGVASTSVALLEKRIKELESRLAAVEAKVRVPAPEVKRNEVKAIPEEDTQVYKIETGQSPVKGNKNAPVTVVEFLDFQCPFSARFHPILAQAIKTYPKEVKYILKTFPLSSHPQARPAAKAALAAGEQGKYWEMVDVLLENGHNLNEETFKKLAGDLGLNVEKFLKDFKEKDEEWEKRLEEDLALIREINVRGTPTFFINGRKTAARDVETLKSEIEKALEEEKKK